MNGRTKTKWTIAAAVAAASMLAGAAPLAFADTVGAPTSAAGGVSKPSSPSRPGAAGPLGSTSGSSVNDTYRPLKLAPGTGKFEGRDNGSKEPCIGSTGFGSSTAQPGRKC